MKKSDLYINAHILVAAIRIHEHRHGFPPSVREICKILSFSPEQVNFLIRKLENLQIINIIQSTNEIKIFIKNHLIIEDIPKIHKENKMEEDIKKIQLAKKAQLNLTLKDLKSQQKQKKKELFAKINDKFKKA